MKKITFLFSGILMMCFSAHSQVQVGFGSNTFQYLPFSPQHSNSYTQSIYLASEINGSGTITSLQWYYAGSSAIPNSQDITIYIGKTTKSVFASKDDWVKTGLTQVFKGVIVTNSQAGWKTIQLTNSFVYNGTDNLVVAVDENKAGADTSTDKFWNSSVTGARSIYWYPPLNSTANADPAAPPTATGTPPYIPNVIFGGLVQACPLPNSLTFTNITSSSATVNWNASVHAGGNSYYRSLTNVPPTASTEPTGSVLSGNSADMTGLSPATTYYVWVKSNCADGDSEWSSGANFITLCADAVTFDENFDNATTPKLPVCWSKIVRGPNLNEATVVETTSQNPIITGSNSVKMFGSNASMDTNDIILVTPNVSNLNSGLYRLKFYAQAQGYQTNARIQIGTLDTNSASTAVFTVLPGYEEVYIGTNITEYTFTITGYTGTDKYIGIKLTTPTSYITLVLDNIRWELDPICKDVTDVVVPVVTGETANVTWNSGGNGDTYDVSVGTATTTDPNTGIIKNTLTNTTFYQVSGLQSLTDYKVWVRSVCHTGGNGAWIGPVTFKSDCPSQENLSEKFDGYTVDKGQTCCDILPNCWSKIITNLGTYNSTYNYVHTSSFWVNYVISSPNSIEMCASYFNSTTPGNNIILVSPPLSTLKLGTHRLKFSAKTPDIGIPTSLATLVIGTLNSATDSATFTPLKSIPISNTTTEYIVDEEFLGYMGPDTHIGFKLESAYDNIGDYQGYIKIYIDNVKWEPNPGCADVTEIKIPTITDTGAHLIWTPNNGEAAWQVAVGPVAVTDPYTITELVDVLEEPETDIINLTSLTSYNVWVRSVCDDKNGAWIGPITFTTSCPAKDHLDENFDAVSGGLPECWSKIIRGKDLNGYSEVSINSNLSYVHSAPLSAVIYKSDYNSGNEIILVTPTLSNIYSGTHRLKFYAMYHPNYNPAILEIGSLNGNTNFSDFTPTKEFTLTNGMVEYEVIFNSNSGYSGNNIGFRISQVNNTKVFIDNVRWEPIPTCADPDLYVKSTTATTATFSWSPNETVDHWEVVTELPYITDPNEASHYTSISNTFIMENLSESTTYNVWVRAVCKIDGKPGSWIGPISYKTDCEPKADLNEDVESAAVPQLPSCWTKILRGATLDPNAKIESVSGNAYMGSNAIHIRNNNSDITDDIILISPRLSSLGAGDHTLSFWGKVDSGLQIGTMSSNQPNAIVNTLIQTIPEPTNYSYQKYTVPFTLRTDDAYIGIRLNPDKKGYRNTYIDNITFDASLATVKFNDEQFEYYPNPVKDVLNISYSKEINSVSIYNLLGQKVLQQSINATTGAIDTSALTRGAYLAKIECNNQVKTVKIVKE